MMKDIRVENFKRLIAHELMVFTQETGLVVEDIDCYPSEDKNSNEVYYDIELGFLNDH